MKLPVRERKSYKRTFLKHVQVLFCYPDMGVFDSQLGIVKSYLESNGYKIEPSSDSGVLIAKTDSLSLTMQNKLLTVQLDAANYCGFEKFKERCGVLVEMLEKLNVSTLETLVLQKMNMYVFPKEHFKKEWNQAYVEQKLYSDEYMAQEQSYTAGDYDGVTLLAQRKFAEQESKYIATLTLTALSQKNTPLSDALQLLSDENQQLFNMFYWATSDVLKDIMSKE